jgi:hypothetical protein
MVPCACVLRCFLIFFFSCVGTRFKCQDYGDGIYLGEYQFRSDAAETDVCVEIKSAINGKPKYSNVVYISPTTNCITSAVAPVCGDGVIDYPEVCDGVYLNQVFAVFPRTFFSQGACCTTTCVPKTGIGSPPNKTRTHATVATHNMHPIMHTHLKQTPAHVVRVATECATGECCDTTKCTYLATNSTCLFNDKAGEGYCNMGVCTGTQCSDYSNLAYAACASKSASCGGITCVYNGVCTAATSFSLSANKADGARCMEGTGTGTCSAGKCTITATAPTAAPAAYTYGAYSACSVTCDTGTQTRTVRTFSSDISSSMLLLLLLLLSIF